MTPAASPPPGRRAVERAVRLLLALFLLCSAWATTHVDVDAGDHEGTAHAAVNRGVVGAPPTRTAHRAVDLVPPVEADAVHTSTADGTTVLVLALAAAVAVVPFVTRADRVRSTSPTRPRRGIPSPSPPSPVPDPTRSRPSAARRSSPDGRFPVDSASGDPHVRCSRDTSCRPFLAARSPTSAPGRRRPRRDHRARSREPRALDGRTLEQIAGHDSDGASEVIARILARTRPTPRRAAAGRGPRRGIRIEGVVPAGLRPLGGADAPARADGTISVVGDPGTGKSTLIRWMAHRRARPLATSTSTATRRSISSSMGYGTRWAPE